MNGIIVRAVLAALVNERVVDRLLALLDHAIKKRNDEQTSELAAQISALDSRLRHVEQLHERIEAMELALAQIVARVQRIERQWFGEREPPAGRPEHDIPSEWDGTE